MRPSQKSNRNRGKSNRGKNIGNVMNRVFESAGPEGKVRGTPQQIIDKYEQLARDAQTAGDRVTAENFLQHAEHYARLLSEAVAAQQAHAQRQSGGEQQPQQRQQHQAPQGQRRADPSEQPQPDAPAGGFNGKADLPMETIDPAQGVQPELVTTPESAGEAPSPKPRAPRRRRAPRRDRSEDPGQAPAAAPVSAAVPDSAEAKAETPRTPGAEAAQG